MGFLKLRWTWKYFWTAYGGLSMKSDWDCKVIYSLSTITGGA